MIFFNTQINSLFFKNFIVCGSDWQNCGGRNIHETSFFFKFFFLEDNIYNIIIFSLIGVIGGNFLFLFVICLLDNLSK